MRFVTSYFKTLVRSDLRHSWPICFGYTFIWLLILPMSLLRDLRYEDIQPLHRASEIIEGSVYAAIFMALFFGVMVAMACYSYLMNSRSVGLLHSLPARRSTHFFAHFTSGMSMMLLGNAVIFVLAVLAQVSTIGKVAWSATLTWLAMATLLDFVFFTLAIFAAMFTGWLLAVPVLYAGINCGIVAIYLVIRSIAEQFYFGYSMSGEMPAFVEWLTPVLRLHVVINEDMNANVFARTWKEVLVYTAGALILLVVSFLLYRMRRSEAAADSVAFSWAKPIFRYIIGIAGGMALGLGIYWLFDDGSIGRGGLLICMLVMTVICYLAAEMLICKSLRVLKTGWKGLVVSCAVIVAIFVVLSFDLFGYERYVPESNEVANVSVGINAANYANGIECSDEETILAAIAAHEAAIEQGDSAAWYKDMVYIYLNYTMKDGSIVTRAYNIGLEKDSPLYQAVNELGNTKQVRHDTLIGSNEDLKLDTIRGGYVDTENGSCQMTAEQARELYTALLKDLESNQTVWDAFDEDVREYCYIEFDTQSNNSRYVDMMPAYCTQAWQIIKSLPIDTVVPFEK